MKEMIYYSSRLVDNYWQTRAGGRLRRGGLRRSLGITPKISIGTPVAQVNIELLRQEEPASLVARYNELRRSLRKELIKFPGEPIGARSQPVIEFEVNAKWGFMAFLGIGKTPNPALIGGEHRHHLMTFWLEGETEGGVVVLVGSAYNLLSVDIAALQASGWDLSPVYNYPSSSEGLTALIQAVCPQMRATVPEDEWPEIDLNEDHVAWFALAVSQRASEDDDSPFYQNYYDDMPHRVSMNRWSFANGVVKGLARVFASARAEDVRGAGIDPESLQDGAAVVVGAPYALYRP